jgi:hypothetical protein
MRVLGAVMARLSRWDVLSSPTGHDAAGIPSPPYVALCDAAVVMARPQQLSARARVPIIVPLGSDEAVRTPREVVDRVHLTSRKSLSKRSLDTSADDVSTDHSAETKGFEPLVPKKGTRP